MGRIYENAEQAIYEELRKISDLLAQILEQLRLQAVRGEGEPHGGTDHRTT